MTTPQQSVHVTKNNQILHKQLSGTPLAQMQNFTSDRGAAISPCNIAAGEQMLVQGLEAIRLIESREVDHCAAALCLKDTKELSENAVCSGKDAPLGRPQSIANTSLS